MKDSGKWAVVFTVLNIILIVTCVVLLLGRDRKAPVISFSENDLIYYSGIDNEKLLQGVAAMDAKNGDVSDRIVVEKIVQNKNEDRAVVYYAVTDLDGNVAKASRVFGAVNESTGNAMKDIGMAGFDGDMDEALSNETEGMTPEIGGNEEMQENVGDMQGEEGEDTQAESSPSMSPSPSASPTPDAEERRGKEQEEADRQAEEEQRQQEEARRKAEEEAAKAGNPKIILKNTTVNTTTGQLPAWIDVIGSFQDDKDGYESLFKNLKASKYDVNAKGDHAVTLTTTDSDGNVSDPVSVTVHVK